MSKQILIEKGIQVTIPDDKFEEITDAELDRIVKVIAEKLEFDLEQLKNSLNSIIITMSVDIKAQLSGYLSSGRIIG